MILLLPIATFAVISTAAVRDTQSRLREALFVGYDPKVVPRNESGEPVEVKLGLAVTHVQSVDILRGSARLSVYLRASWVDPRLTWKSSEYEGLNQTLADVTDIWVPDFLAYNHLDRFEKGIRHRETAVWLYADGGGIYWSRPAVIDILAKYDLSDFPYDVQMLEIHMGSWSLNGHFQNLSVMEYVSAGESLEDRSRRIIDGQIDMDNFISSAEFHVTTEPALTAKKYYACCPRTPWPVVTFRLRLKRKWEFYARNVIAPVIVVTTLSFAVFALPHQSGERTGLGVTCILVVTGLMYSQRHMLPITDQNTLLSFFYRGCLVFTSLSLLVSIVSFKFFHRCGEAKKYEELKEQAHEEQNKNEEQKNSAERRISVTSEELPGDPLMDGISAQTAMVTSVRIDYYSKLTFPAAFAGFNMYCLYPSMDKLTRIVLGVLTCSFVFFSWGMLYLLNQLIRKHCFGESDEALNKSENKWAAVTGTRKSQWVNDAKKKNRKKDVEVKQGDDAEHKDRIHAEEKQGDGAEHHAYMQNILPTDASNEDTGMPQEDNIPTEVIVQTYLPTHSKTEDNGAKQKHQKKKDKEKFKRTAQD